MTTHLDPSMQAALTADAPLLAYCVEIDFPGFTVRLTDGPVDLEVNGNLFLGQDPTYGFLASLDAVEDGMGASAPHLTLQIHPPSNTAAAAMSGAGVQAAPVTCWIVAVSRATGAPIGAAYEWFSGDIDIATILVDRNLRAVKLDCESAWDRFFDVDEGLLLTNACHQAFWPGELGLEYVTEIQAQIPWGQDVPRPVVVTDVIGGNPDYTNLPQGGAGGGFSGGSSGWRIPQFF